MEAVIWKVEVSQEGEVANIWREDPTQMISGQAQLHNSLVLVAAYDSMPVTEVT